MIDSQSPVLGGRRAAIGRGLGPLLALTLLLLPAPEGLSTDGWRVAAVGAWMAVWWLTEAIPIPATSLLPIALYPSLGIMRSAETTPEYSHHLIYLFMGGFLLAIAMEKWNLHRRIALSTISLVGVAPSRCRCTAWPWPRTSRTTPRIPNRSKPSRARSRSASSGTSW